MSKLQRISTLQRSAYPWLLCTLLFVTVPTTPAQKKSAAQTTALATLTIVEIIRAEDERRLESVKKFLSDNSSAVRLRAALAAGRIGDVEAVPVLSELLRTDSDQRVRAMAAFALGEIESVTAADDLVVELNKGSQSLNVRARILEALGKIAAANLGPEPQKARSLGEVTLKGLDLEHKKGAQADSNLILLGLTASLRARPKGAGKVIAQFLSHPLSRIRADAANALARLRANDGNEHLRRLLISDPDPIVRANSARALGATEDKSALAVLLDRAARDSDSRVRVSAIRALASLRDIKATKPLLVRGLQLTEQRLRGRPSETNEVLEIVTALGSVARGSSNEEVISWLRLVRDDLNNTAPEVETALVRVSPAQYLASFGEGDVAVRTVQETLILHWRSGASVAQALGDIASLPDLEEKKIYSDRASELLRAMLDYRKSDITVNTLINSHPERGIGEVLRAFAMHKPGGLEAILRARLQDSDVIVRATAAELLSELEPNEETTRALALALPRAMKDELNDAALAILDALAKQKSDRANEVIKSAFNTSDSLLRQRAALLLKGNGVGDFSGRIGPVQSRNTIADYQRAVSRIGKQVRATVATSKGQFTIELLPADAPLNVDNFVELAKKDYFRGITFHRVVPNFVIQGGDPRGDGNGGPGYQIRCEINEVPYDRGVVGMALSGKDTGGSQWFVTHSPQPHLDGGYTVFGRVVSGMEVVDKITRGDVIRSINVTEGQTKAQRPRRKRKR